MNESIKPAIDVFPLRQKASFSGPSEVDFLIRITPPQTADERTRPRRNLGLVIDCSTSMSGRKIEEAKSAACRCIGLLHPEDRVSVTTFSDKARVIVPPTLVKNLRDFQSRVEGIKIGYGSALHAGWAKGGELVAASMAPWIINRVILFTDGRANVGQKDPQVIASQARGLFEKGISTSTIGFGSDFREDLLCRMAQGAGGHFGHIRTLADFRAIFDEEMDRSTREVCSRVSLKIDPAPGVEVLEILNDFEWTDFGSMKLPSLLLGEPMDVVVRVKLPGGVPGACHCFGLTLKWNQYGTNQRFSSSLAVPITYAWLESNEVKKAVKKLEAARARKKAIEFIDEGSYQLAVQHLMNCSAALRIVGDLLQDDSLRLEAMQLMSLAADIHRKKDLSMIRKDLRYQSSQSQWSRRGTGGH